MNLLFRLDLMYSSLNTIKYKYKYYYSGINPVEFSRPHITLVILPTRTNSTLTKLGVNWETLIHFDKATLRSRWLNKLVVSKVSDIFGLTLKNLTKNFS